MPTPTWSFFSLTDVFLICSLVWRMKNIYHAILLKAKWRSFVYHQHWQEGTKDSTQPCPFEQTTCKSLPSLFNRWVADTVAPRCQYGKRALQHLMGKILIPQGTQTSSLAKDGVPSTTANGACWGRQHADDCSPGGLSVTSAKCIAGVSQSQMFRMWILPSTPIRSFSLSIVVTASRHLCSRYRKGSQRNFFFRATDRLFGASAQFSVKFRFTPLLIYFFIKYLLWTMYQVRAGCWPETCD